MILILKEQNQRAEVELLKAQSNDFLNFGLFYLNNTKECLPHVALQCSHYCNFTYVPSAHGRAIFCANTLNSES